MELFPSLGGHPVILAYIEMHAFFRLDRLQFVLLVELELLAGLIELAATTRRCRRHHDPDTFRRLERDSIDSLKVFICQIIGFRLHRSFRSTLTLLEADGLDYIIILLLKEPSSSI